VKRRLIHWFGLAGIAALLSYTAAVVFSPAAYPGYDWMSQAVSDLSAENAPSRLLWNQLAAVYNAGSVVCVSCVSVFVSEHRTGTKLFRFGIYLFALMNWVSAIGYAMFPLADSGKEIAAFQEIMHIAVTAAVVFLSVVSLAVLIIAGFRNKELRRTGTWALTALVMMMTGAIGQGIVPAAYFGIAERFSVFATAGFTAVLGWELLNGFGGVKTDRAVIL
jgi:hypothetical membrane protein